MPRRRRIRLEDIADTHNLYAAAWLASRGKRNRRRVRQFLQSLDSRIFDLQKSILNGHIRLDEFKAFCIRDPKLRTIHAPSFRLRILYQAVIRQCGPNLEKALINDSFACVPGRGPLQAVKRVQHFARRSRWFLKLDMEKYFHSIDHELLFARLSRRFKGAEFLEFLQRLLSGFQSDLSTTERHCGLPIGALTSQYFANLYLNDADRWLQAQPECRGLVRYMDDTVCWFDTRDEAKRIRLRVEEFLADQLHLRIGSRTELNRTDQGITFCGHRIFPGIIRLSARRERLYQQHCRRWEGRFLRHEINERQLQQAYASAWSLVKHADSTEWLKRRQGKLHLVDEI